MAHIAKGKPTKFTIDEIVKILMDESENHTMEGQLIKPKLIRELYKQVGDPQEEDFPDEYRIAGRCWKKICGYTTDIGVSTAQCMEAHNKQPTTWYIKRPSMTKVNIVDRYTRAGWNCAVQAYNVMCDKYVKHPKYNNLWVRFYSSRDCNKYEYVIEVE